MQRRTTKTTNGQRFVPGGRLGQILARYNMAAAWKRVKANKGICGVDDLTIEQTAEHLKTQWPVIRQRIVDGK